MRAALLGPQRRRPILGRVAAALGIAGPVAAITAGWQERESDDGELADLDLELRRLDLWRRRDEVRSDDAAFATAADELRHDIDEVRRLYRLRLDHVLDAAREILHEPGEAQLVLPERRAALAAVADLDRHFAARLDELRASRPQLAAHPAIAAQRRELAALAVDCDAVLIAGGHVVELLDCLRLFAADELLRDRTVIAWSAGAMALTPLVVGFHDSPPQGAGNAEVLDRGLALCPGLVALPHARRRLALDDAHRVALMARRFAPARCLALDEGDWLRPDGAAWAAEGDVRLLAENGTVVPAGRLPREAG